MRPVSTPADVLRDRLLCLAQHKAKITDHREKSWASITFQGARHCIDLTFGGFEAVETGECFIERLAEHLFDIPGQLVADAKVIEVDHALGENPSLRVSVEVLLLDDEPYTPTLKARAARDWSE